jgi:hypothetical protein
VRAAARHPLDEGAVHLEHVDRELLQLAERRVAGAEVVDRDAHAERAQAGEPLAHQLGRSTTEYSVISRHQRAGREPRLGERHRDLADERRVLQLLPRHVHGHAQRLRPARSPAA